MSPREKLQLRDKGILERKFIHNVLTEEGQDLIAGHRDAIKQLLNTSGLLGAGLSYSVKDAGVAGGTLSVTHLKRQRFLDMKTRNNKAGGRFRKKAYTIHNRQLFGRLNNIIASLKYGFVQAVKDKIIREQTIQING